MLTMKCIDCYKVISDSRNYCDNCLIQKYQEPSWADISNNSDDEFNQN